MSTYLRIPIASHTGPRGLEPDLIRKGWLWKRDQVVPAIQRLKPRGVILCNPFGERPHEPMSLRALEECRRDLGETPVTNTDELAQFVEEVHTAVRVHTAHPAPRRVGIYMGGGFPWANHTLRTADLFLEESLAWMDPAFAFPLIDALGDATAPASAMLANTLTDRFGEAGYEPLPLKGNGFASSKRLVCYCTGWWFHTQRDQPGREASANLGHELIVQCESPYGTEAHARAAVAAGASVALDWYALDQYPSLLPAAGVPHD